MRIITPCALYHCAYDLKTRRRLTLVTVIFLPLSLLTGYFGMNFDDMWIHDGKGDY